MTADSIHYRDLYWACRGGGGGNFGIVTRLVFHTHPVAEGSYFIATWPWAQVEDVLANFLHWAPTAPDALGSVCRLATGPTGPTVQVFGQFLGSETNLKAALATLGPPAQKLVTGTSTWLDLVRRWAGCLGHTLPACSTPGHQPQPHSARSWANASRASLASATSGAAYVNYIDPALKDWQHAYYGSNLERLRRAKHRYDPHNLFHFAQSIPLA